MTTSSARARVPLARAAATTTTTTRGRSVTTRASSDASSDARSARDEARVEIYRKPSEDAVRAWTSRVLRPDALWLAPLTKGGNYPFRRLCEIDFGCRVTVSEMAFARFLGKGNRVERARVRRVREREDLERAFGAQIATNAIGEGVRAGLIASQEFGADFVDLNCGCPIHETWKRGLGAALLKKPAKLERLVEGIANGIDVPLTVKIRLGIDGSSQASRIAESLENAGASAIVVHGRTKEQRYTSASDYDVIKRLVEERAIPIIGNGDVLTYYDAVDRMKYSGVSAMMVGRGALIKPWIFKEFAEGKEWLPTALERVGVYYTLRTYMMESFGDDDIGKRRYDDFMPWHMGFFCRYRPLPEALFAGRAINDPLLQSRLDVAVEGELREELSSVERLLRCSSADAHAAISEILWEASSPEDAMNRLEDAAKASLEEWTAQVAAGSRGASVDTIRG